MKIHTLVYSTSAPAPITITDTKVFIASNIQAAERQCEDQIEQCYSYTITEYDKDEYILLLAQNNIDLAELQEELRAAKILLGVE